MRRAALLLVLAVVACKKDDGNPNDVDAYAGEPRAWQLVDRPYTAVRRNDGAPLTDARVVRLVVDVDLMPCELLAMIHVEYAAPQVVVMPRVWVAPQGERCFEEARTVPRPVALDLPVGTWTITTRVPGHPTLLIGVEAGAADCDADRRDPCEADCDCAAGERCIGYDSLIGARTTCRRPCELDRDCAGGSCEGAVTDGLSFFCYPDDPECGDDDDVSCPRGWSCSDGECTPDFELSQSTRVGCDLDDDCEEGLNCVVSKDDGDERRCQALCRTAGPWCPGAHVCGSIADDLAGLATTDSVCGFVGD
jgi:hypothetical protein